MLPLQSYCVNINQNVMIQEAGGDDSIKSSESKSKEAYSHKEAERRRRQRINVHLSTLRSLLKPNQDVVIQEAGGDDSIKSSESKSKEACSHKEAERRRRQRINAHLSTLRSLLPDAVKTDKASLLAEVVRHVKELRRQVDEIARQDGEGCCGSSAGSWPFPGECDEATLNYCDEKGKLVKATVCCEDRPGLTRDLTRAIGMVQAKAVRAEMMTVGGRTKNVVVMEWVGAGGGEEEELRALKRALKNVVQNRATVSGLGYRDRSKRRAPVDGWGKDAGHG